MAHYPDRICDMSPEARAAHDSMCEAYSRFWEEEGRLAAEAIKAFEAKRLTMWASWVDTQPDCKCWIAGRIVNDPL